MEREHGISRRRISLALAFLPWVLYGCQQDNNQQDNNISGEHDFAEILIFFPKGRTKPESGVLTYEIKAGALLRIPQHMEDINQRPFRCKIIVEAPLPTVRILGGIGLSNESRVRQSWNAWGTALNPNIPHTFTLEWNLWRVTKAAWDSNPIPFQSGGEIF